MTSERNDSIGAPGRVLDVQEPPHPNTRPDTARTPVPVSPLTAAPDLTGIDETDGQDVTLPHIEHEFDQGAVASRLPAHGSGQVFGQVSGQGNGTDDDDGAHGPDDGDGLQNRRLTLLQGGVVRRPFRPNGVPVSTTFPVVRDALRHDPPLLRYKPTRALSPLWSATTTWTDLTTQHTVPALSDLPDGWGSQWTLRYRHGNQKHTTSVASVSTGDLLDADPIRVNTWHPKKSSRAGLRYLHSTDRHHAHESLFERKLLCVLDFAQADKVVSQPFTLTWHDGTRVRHHTPDFMTMVDGHVTVINTRPGELVRDRLIEDASALGEMCLSRGWSHALVTGYALPGFTTVETVETHARDHDRLGYADTILGLLAQRGPTPFIEVCHEFEGHVVARAIVQRLIWERRVSVDLNTLLQDGSLVALPGQEPTP